MLIALTSSIAGCIGAADLGNGVYRVDFVGSSREATAEEILAATRASRVTANRGECSNRILARYPAGRQLSALAGMYDSAQVQTMHDWISSMIAAENAAADAIEAATTVQEVEAVTVTWPA